MTRNFTRLGFAALLVLLVASASGCAATAVHPWDRDLMADKRMRLGALPLEPGRG